jgi:cytochrome P450
MLTVFVLLTISRFMFQVMGLYNFGFDYGMFEWTSDSYNDFCKLMDCLMNAPAAVHAMDFWGQSLLPYYRQASSILRRIYKSFKAIILTKGGNYTGNDILSKLLVTHKTKCHGRTLYSEKDIKHDMMALFFSGHEKTASTLSFIVYYFSIFFITWQTSLREELMSLFEKPDGPADNIAAQQAEREIAFWQFLKDIQVDTFQARCPLLSAFIAEVMRLYPAVAITSPRISMQKELEWSMYKIYRGSDIRFDIRSSNRCPQLFPFPNCDFYPERFIQEGVFDAKKASLLMNFGIGKHQCPAHHIVMHQIYMVNWLLQLAECLYIFCLGIVLFVVLLSLQIAVWKPA